MMSKKKKSNKNDILIDDPYHNLNPEQIRQMCIDLIYNHEKDQFIMDNVTVPDDDEEIEHNEPFVETQQSENKGRVLIAKINFQPGDVILREKPLAAASWSEFHCMECLKPHKPSKCSLFNGKYPPSLKNNIDKLEEIFADEDIIGEIDRARIFIKMLYMYHCARDAPAFQQFMSLTTVKDDESLECIRQLRKKRVVIQSDIFPNTMPDIDAARILAILNCNSHEIDFVGSGLFLRSSMMEHDCTPNCNFIAEKDNISVMCIRPIKAGEPLSIDYAHAFYQPTSVRQKAHQVYGFTCTCLMCTAEPDRPRAFYCPRGVQNILNKTSQQNTTNTYTPETCHAGLVCPIGTGNSPQDWKCLYCGYQLTEEEVKTCLNAEQRFPPPPEIDDESMEEEIYEIHGMKMRGFDDIAEMLADNVLHESHYSVFWSMMGLALRTTKQASNKSVPTIGKGRNSQKQKKAAEKAQAERSVIANQALMVWQRIINATSLAIPYHHPNKVNYIDHMAQVKILAKDIPGAKDLWRQAYELSVIVNGEHTLNTKQLLKLYTRTPRTVDAMQYHYQNMHELLDKISYEEDKENAHLLTMLAESTLEQEEFERENNPIPGEENIEESSDDDEEEEDMFANQRIGFAAAANEYLQSQGFAPVCKDTPSGAPTSEVLTTPQITEPTPIEQSSNPFELSFKNIESPAPASNPFTFKSEQKTFTPGNFEFRG